MKKAKRYSVTLRRDVQQILVLNIDALSKQEAIETAEACSDSFDWVVEEHIGTHKPTAQVLK